MSGEDNLKLEITCLRQQLLNLQDMFLNHVHEGTSDKPLIIRERTNRNKKSSDKQ